MLVIPPAQAAAGTRTYHMRLNPVAGFDWCFDYVFHVWLVAVE